MQTLLIVRRWQRRPSPSMQTQAPIGGCEIMSWLPNYYERYYQARRSKPPTGKGMLIFFVLLFFFLCPKFTKSGKHVFWCLLFKSICFLRLSKNTIRKGNKTPLRLFLLLALCVFLIWIPRISFEIQTISKEMRVRTNTILSCHTLN